MTQACTRPACRGTLRLRLLRGDHRRRGGLARPGHHDGPERWIVFADIRTAAGSIAVWRSWDPSAKEGVHHPAALNVETSKADFAGVAAVLGGVACGEREAEEGWGKVH